MNNWQQFIIRDIARTNVSSYSNDDNWSYINYLDTGNVTQNIISEIQRLIVNVDKIPSRARRKVQAGDIIYSTVRPINRHYGFIDKPIKNMLVSTGFTVITVDDTKAFPKFIYYYLSLDSVTQSLQVIAEHSTSTYPSIKPSDLETLEVFLPPLPEQQAIAHVLGTLDDKIELNRRMNRTLEAMARATFKSWFVDFDPVIDNALNAGSEIPDQLADRAAMRRDLGDDRKPLPEEIRSRFPSRFVESELGWIPEGWTIEAFSDIADIRLRKSLKKGKIAPYLDMSSVSETGMMIKKKPIAKNYTSGTRFCNGDVLLARITPCLENGKTALVNFLPKETVGWGSTEFIVIRPKKSGRIFNYCLARSVEFRLFAINNMSGTSGRQRVNKEAFNNYILANPDEAIFHEFEKINSSYVERIKINSDEIALLEEIRDALLPKLISGEIRVPQAEKAVGAAV